MADSDKNEDKPDPRVAATSVIAGTSVGMLAICIPLVAVMKNPIFPFVVVGGAALAIAGVWYFGRNQGAATQSKEIATLESTIEDLKERLENVEVINRYEATLAERSLEEMDEGTTGKSMGPTAES